MLTKVMMQEIQDLKLQGYAMNEIASYYEGKGMRNNSNNGHLCISSVYDVLEEKFIENGEFEALPGNQQTFRNYVRYLRENGIVVAAPKNTRIYDHVFDTAPGEQMLIDFGEIRITRGVKVHFICLLLRYSVLSVSLEAGRQSL